MVALSVPTAKLGAGLAGAFTGRSVARRACGVMHCRRSAALDPGSAEQRCRTMLRIAQAAPRQGTEDTLAAQPYLSTSACSGSLIALSSATDGAGASFTPVSKKSVPFCEKRNCFPRCLVKNWGSETVK
jgi:hypothetical protein